MCVYVGAVRPLRAVSSAAAVTALLAAPRRSLENKLSLLTYSPAVRQTDAAIAPPQKSGSYEEAASTCDSK